MAEETSTLRSVADSKTPGPGGERKTGEEGTSSQFEVLSSREQSAAMTMVPKNPSE